jgi:hypothetical protein
MAYRRVQLTGRKPIWNLLYSQASAEDEGHWTQLGEERNAALWLTPEQIEPAMAERKGAKRLGLDAGATQAMVERALSLHEPLAGDMPPIAQRESAMAMPCCTGPRQPPIRHRAFPPLLTQKSPAEWHSFSAARRHRCRPTRTRAASMRGPCAEQVRKGDWATAAKRRPVSAPSVASRSRPFSSR